MARRAMDPTASAADEMATTLDREWERSEWTEREEEQQRLADEQHQQRLMRSIRRWERITEHYRRRGMTTYLADAERTLAGLWQTFANNEDDTPISAEA